MWVVDRNKERKRDLAMGEVDNLIARLSQHRGSTQKVIAELCYAVGGTPSGRGEALVEDCRQAADQLSMALQELRACRAALSRASVMVWVDDD